MTLNALLNAPDVFRAGISGAPVTSWMNYDTIYTERYMGLPKENAEAYKNTIPASESCEPESEAHAGPQLRGRQRTVPEFVANDERAPERGEAVRVHVVLAEDARGQRPGGGSNECEHARFF